jgi:hypothetical protein
VRGLALRLPTRAAGKVARCPDAPRPCHDVAALGHVVRTRMAESAEIAIYCNCPKLQRIPL